ncbi:F-BOX/KELCH-REPEAT PROTEIN SKIP11 [Salix koriyanagi]|uniref:F-BOX/KELCH-REPEAT PROTEIN SKIP11 n=1 Tax=Salix koriyanagi TaxID=2511006 RepID=A0A9Q0PGW7_9ROSI|nr:F-BOX/KELCH-REPEAT PROTEIN SKIP11 [Salix koriyanagi]
MLEASFYPVARELPASCEQEKKWIYNACCAVELSNKRPLEGGEDVASRKAAKLLEGHETQEKMEALHAHSIVHTDQQDNQYQHVLSIAQTNQLENHHQVENQSDSCSLINQLGRDLSISCLLNCSRSDYGVIASLNKSFQSLVRSGQLYKLRREAGIVERWVYFSCNLLEWKAYDPIRCRWLHLPRMTSNECSMWSDKESLAVGTDLLVFGMEIMAHVIYRYSILTNTWTSGMKMNTPRCLFGSASLGEIAILAGGCDPRGNVLNSAELYNSETGTWMLTCGEAYDLKTRMWHEVPDMLPARNGGAGMTETPAAAEAPPLVAVVNNELYAAVYAQNEVRKYDKQNNLWITLGRLPEQAVSMNGWGLAFRACGDRLIVVGGPRDLGGGMIELHSWAPSEGPPQWDLLARKPSVTNHQSAQLDHGFAEEMGIWTAGVMLNNTFPVPAKSLCFGVFISQVQSSK